MADEFENDANEQPGGSLADAIAAHMALKKDRGADPDEIEHELEDALSPPLREEEPVATAPEPEPEPEPQPEPALAAEPEPEAEPEPPVVEQPKPGEITGTIEFEFGDDETPSEPAPESVSEHDLLEDTPDFFEETPEHDKLWFDEKSPRKFDF